MQKPIIVAIAIAFAAMLWMFRYDLQIGQGGTAHVLDRWTGQISWIRAADIEPVTPVPPPRLHFDQTAPAQGEVDKFLQGSK